MTGMEDSGGLEAAGLKRSDSGGYQDSKTLKTPCGQEKIRQASKSIRYKFRSPEAESTQKSEQNTLFSFYSPKNSKSNSASDTDD